MISSDVELGKRVLIAQPELVNIYGCRIGDDTKIGPFVEIQKGVVVGQKCKISSHSFLCEGVTLGDRVFVGHGVIFVNDLYPKATNDLGMLQTEDDWEVIRTWINDGVSIGSNATILAGLTIGENAIVGAGAVVTKSVSNGVTIAGNPGQVIHQNN